MNLDASSVPNVSALSVSLGPQRRNQDATAPAYANLVLKEQQFLLALIEEIAAAPSQNDAAKVLANQFAKLFPSASVRCGVGAEKMRRLFDSRLGMLGPATSAFERASENWPTAIENVSTHTFNTNILTICLHNSEHKHGNCVIWVEGESLASRPHSWLDACIPAMCRVYWSRPHHTWHTRLAKLLNHTGLTVVAMSFLLITALVWPVDYRVASTATVLPVQQRLVAAPFEATLLAAHVRPGDSVKQGDILFELDGRPLRLELESITAEIQQSSKEHDVAMASGRIADSQQALLKERQLSRKRDLLLHRLDRLEVASPINGVVVSGDLEQFVGAPLELGQTLIEVAPMNRMAIEIEIPAHEIGYVRKNAQTRVKIDAIGGRSMMLPLEIVYPAAEVRDDQNVFIGRIKVDNNSGHLRPGMKGDAIIYGPCRPLIWSWVRGGIERVLWWIGF